MKKGFSLVELIIVMLLISIVASLTFSNLNFGPKKYQVELQNLKAFLLNNFEFQNDISLVCINEQNLPCYIIQDSVVLEDKLENLFSQTPVVYAYNKNLTKVNFSSIKIDNINYEVFFKLTLNRDNKHENLIVDTLEGDVFLFYSISKDIKRFQTTNAILDSIFEKEVELQNAI